MLLGKEEVIVLFMYICMLTCTTHLHSLYCKIISLSFHLYSFMLTYTTHTIKCMMVHAHIRLLLSEGYEPDIIYTSRLKRAVKSTWTILNALSAPYLPVYKSWRLNERNYGALTGLKKMDAAKELGMDVVQAWYVSVHMCVYCIRFCFPKKVVHTSLYIHPYTCHTKPLL